MLITGFSDKLPLNLNNMKSNKNHTIYTFFAKVYGHELTIEEKQKIDHSLRKEEIKKKQLIFGQGDENTRHYFIEKGLLRMYVIDQAGKEFNILFARENQWIGDLITPAATPFYLDAVENSIVYSFDDEKLHNLTDGFSYFAQTFKRSYIFLQRRLVSILSKTAEENYEELLLQYPELIQRLPQYHISAYLGVTPEFLSKIISKITKQK